MAAENGQILMTEKCYNDGKEFYKCHSVGNTSLKNKSGEVKVIGRAKKK